MSDTRPEFIRLPEDGETCPHSGLKRGTMRNLCIPSKVNGYKPAVPAKCLRQPGNLRGIWLIPYVPLMAHINALPTPGLLVESQGGATQYSGKLASRACLAGGDAGSNPAPCTTSSAAVVTGIPTAQAATGAAPKRKFGGGGAGFTSQRRRAERRTA